MKDRYNSGGIEDTTIEAKKASDIFQIKIFVGFLATVIAMFILQQMKNIFVPLFMALLLYFLFNGAVKTLVAKKIPISLVLGVLLVFIFILFYFFGLLIYSSASSFIEKFPTYTGRIGEMVQNLFTQLKIPVADLNSYLAKIDWNKAVDTSSITSFLSTTFGSFAAFIGNLLLVLVYLMFMLAGRKALTGRLNKAFEINHAQKMEYIINAIENQVQHYLVVKTFISLSTAIVCAIILFSTGMDFVVFSALLIFVFNYIPNIGSIVATFFPILFGVLKYGFCFRVLFMTLGLMATQFIIGNVLDPKLTGKSLNLSPIIILVSLIFWGYIWGIVGMILAVPLTSALKIIFQNITILRPIAELISGE